MDLGITLTDFGVTRLSKKKLERMIELSPKKLGYSESWYKKTSLDFATIFY